MKYAAVIVAAGSSSRFKADVNKLLYPIDGKKVIDKTIDIFLSDNDCEKIIVVVNQEVGYYLKDRTDIYTTIGGTSRSESVFNGLKLVDSEYVLIHDGARCFLSKRDLDNLKEQLTDAAILTAYETDTLKQVKDGCIVSTVDRNLVQKALTPQAFKTELIRACYYKANNDDYIATDDASIVERYSDIKIKCVIALDKNIKITTLNDVKGD